MYLLQFPLLFFLFSLSSASFDDSLARSFMFPLSSAAYSNHPQRCLTNKIKGAQVSKQVMLNCDYFKHDKCSGYTFFDESRKVIGIAFRGTGDTVQLIVEITDTVFNAKVDFQDGGQTSKYFNDAFIDVRCGMVDLLRTSTICWPSIPIMQFGITGHSLGGALASLAAAHIAANNLVPKERIILYTFGQPRTGDQKYADIHDNLVTAFRVTHAKDIVAHVPPQFMKYEHHTSEVWYDNDMTPDSPFVVCSKQEDTNCSDQNPFNSSSDDNDSYYGHNAFDWGLEGCPS